MKKFLILIFSLLIISCGNSVPSNDPHNFQNNGCTYKNINCKIIKKGVNKDNENYLLIQCVEDPGLYCEFAGFQDEGIIKSKFDMHEIGDILHFDYVSKKRFFYIRKNIDQIQTESQNIEIPTDTLQY